MSKDKMTYVVLLVLLASILFNLYGWFKPVTTDKGEEDRLKAQNELLEAKTDSLMRVNDLIDERNKIILLQIDSLNVKIGEGQRIISKLKRKRNESDKIIDSLDDGGLDSLFSNITLP